MRTSPGRNLNERKYSGHCGGGNLCDMNRQEERAGPGRPRVDIALRSGRRRTEVRIRVNWSCRLSVPAAARLLVVVVLVLAAAAVVTSAGGELSRGVLYTLAGLLAGSRPRARP